MPIVSAGNCQYWGKTSFSDARAAYMWLSIVLTDNPVFSAISLCDSSSNRLMEKISRRLGGMRSSAMRNNRSASLCMMGSTAECPSVTFSINDMSASTSTWSAMRALLRNRLRAWYLAIRNIYRSISRLPFHTSGFTQSWVKTSCAMSSASSSVLQAFGGKTLPGNSSF